MLVLMMMISFSFKPATLVAEDTIQSPCMYQESNKDCVFRLVDMFAKKYHVNAPAMKRTLTNENPSFDFYRQSDCVYKKKNRWNQPAGSREKSYGVAQIHLLDHSNITLAQATDPVFSVEFMAKQFALGHQRYWSGYKG